MGVPLGIDDLELSVSNLLSQVRRPVEERDPIWAHNICTLTRFVHINVWASSPSKKDVKLKIIPLLTRAIKELDDVNGAITKTSEKVDMDLYKRNIQFRINNLQRYVKGYQSIPVAELDRELSKASKSMR